MAYNDDAVLARLSSLNESHDSIATAAQWIMFHRRHADRTVQLWVQRLKDSSSTKRLSLMYLANEVAQQSRIRHKEDFIIAFSPVIAEAAAIAYKGAPTEVQGKLRRVFEVWRDRSIFEAPIQRAIESRLDELDKSRGAPKGAFGGAIFGSSSSVPSEFAPLVSAHQAVAKLGVPLSGTIASANQEYEKQTDAATEVPSAPVYAARLNGLLKTLASAENAVAERVKARQTLVTGLEKLLETNRQELDKDQATVTQLSTRKTEIEEKKQQVELAIMRALGPAEGNGTPGEGDSASSSREPDRPQMEALTPPAMEALTPPAMEALTPPSVTEEPLVPQEFNAASAGADAQAQDASNGSSHQSVSISANGSNKRRRVDDGDFPDLGGDDGIDEDVAAMLKT